MKHMILAAERGDAAAQFNLGVVYDNRLDDNGHAIKGGRTEALKWLKLAALQGLARAQAKLAEVYAEWPSTSANDTNACAWYLLAIDNSTGAHRHKAQSGYDRVSARLEPEQKEAARRLARRWNSARDE